MKRFRIVPIPSILRIPDDKRLVSLNSGDTVWTKGAGWTIPASTRAILNPAPARIVAPAGFLIDRIGVIRFEDKEWRDIEVNAREIEVDNISLRRLNDDGTWTQIIP